MSDSIRITNMLLPNNLGKIHPVYMVQKRARFIFTFWIDDKHYDFEENAIKRANELKALRDFINKPPTYF